MGSHRVIHNSTCIIPFARNVYGYIIEVGGDINTEIIKEEQNLNSRISCDISQTE